MKMKGIGLKIATIFTVCYIILMIPGFIIASRLSPATEVNMLPGAVVIAIVGWVLIALLTVGIVVPPHYVAQEMEPGGVILFYIVVGGLGTLSAGVSIRIIIDQLRLLG
jgi:hypothetical protein